MDGSNFNSKAGGVQSFTSVPETENKTADQDVEAPKTKNGRKISFKKTIKSLFSRNKKGADKGAKSTNLSDRKIKPSNPQVNHSTRNSLKPLSDSAPEAVLSAAAIPLLSKPEEFTKVDITITVSDAPVPDAPVPDAPVPDAPVPDAPVPDAPVPDNPVLDTIDPDISLSETPVAEPSAPDIISFAPVSSSPDVTPVPEEPDFLLEEVPVEVASEVTSPVELLTEAASTLDKAAPSIEAGADAMAPADAAGDVVPPIEISIDVTTETVTSNAAAAMEAAAVDVGIGAISHGITMGLKMHKLSKLEQRKSAFEACPKLVKKWEGGRPMLGQKMSQQDMKDYAKIAKLSADDTASVSKQDPLRMVLGESKCHYANDQQILRLTNSLLQLTEKKGRLTQSVHKRLDEWQKKFKDRAEKFDERIKNGKTSKEDGLLKAGHQSKKMMKEFNDIVKTMGVKIDYSTPVKQGKSALASRHKFVIDDKKLHSFLTKSAQLPEKVDIKEHIVSYKNDAETLKAFSGYEARKIKHQSSQLDWTAGAMLASIVPVLQVDKAVRSGREFAEHSYREQNNKILDFKLNKLGDLFRENFQLVEQKPTLKNALDLAVDVIRAKKDRTEIKSDTALAHGAIDVVGATAGTAAAILAPGVGSLATNAVVGAARMATTIAGAADRYVTDKKNQQFGRIETKVYTELKKAHNEIPAGDGGAKDRAAIRNITCQLFDISNKQADLLFAQDPTQDLVSGKGMIRLRFNNFKIKDIQANSASNIESSKGSELPPPPQEWLDDINSMPPSAKGPEKDAPPPEK
ncbi:hypothetical protein [Endozoicomonas elysicola]|uniref:Uncharacterized protein n=1 Tax=Endozoicomonas elysicola TaxID=305900 RepID=A0A081K981_9GAMM|nr:hypothetical protein [Endozoicomonas elysicola]KEI70707.1 hypothetical protein GV64_08095 [Endozoicomonas elysicola]